MRIVICLLLGITSVASTMAQSAPSSVGDFRVDTNNPEHAAIGHTPDGSHKLEAGDQISFQITEDKKPATNLVVTDSGEVHAPYVGRVEVAGKTCREVAAELKVLLEKDYYYHATVVVGLDTMNKVEKMNKVIGQVLIWGEVRNPGSVDVLSGHTLTLGEAILRVGGLTINADMKRVKVVRNDGRGSTHVVEVNIGDLMEKGKTEKDIAIEPNDYIIVPSRLFRF